MKKLLGIICVLCFAFSLSACEKEPLNDSGMGNDSPLAMEERSTNIAQETDENEAKELQKAREEAEQGVNEREIDVSALFGNINGCAVIYLPSQEQYLFFNEKMCRREVSPYSTFKIISALSGLQNGVIVDELSVMGYDGTDYGNSEWNGRYDIKAGVSEVVHLVFSEGDR